MTIQENAHLLTKKFGKKSDKSLLNIFPISNNQYNDFVTLGDNSNDLLMHGYDTIFNLFEIPNSRLFYHHYSYAIYRSNIANNTLIIPNIVGFDPYHSHIQGYPVVLNNEHQLNQSNLTFLNQNKNSTDSGQNNTQDTLSAAYYPHLDQKNHKVLQNL